MDVASFLQNAIVVMIVAIVLAFVGITILEKFQQKQVKQERIKELQTSSENVKQGILKIRNLLTNKEDYCQGMRKNLKNMYEPTFELLNEVGFRHMGSYISKHIGNERYEKLLKDKERYLNYKEDLAKRCEDYSNLRTSFEDYISREMTDFSELEQDVEQNEEDIRLVVENVKQGISNVEKSIREMKSVELEGSLELLTEEEVDNVKKLVAAGEVKFRTIIHAVAQEKGNPNTRIWASHMPYDEETGEPIYGCFEVDDMAINDTTRLGDRLGGGSTGLNIAACKDCVGLLFSDKPFTLRFIDEDGEEEIRSQIKEYYLEEKNQYFIDCLLGDKQWSIELKA